jgi:hypothetical protein
MLNVVSDIRTSRCYKIVWIGMVGHMAVDNYVTVWTIVAVEVLVHQSCFHLGIHYLAYFLGSVLRCSFCVCEVDSSETMRF